MISKMFFGILSLSLAVLILLYMIKKNKFFYLKSSDKFYNFSYNSSWIILAILMIVIGVMWLFK